ncbi:hypothetical protein [Syntrophothermus lipocalidus]|uniref:VCBS repeat-containing protein n=1 Tax=Syntrophothermus lipocalidus (strain DSM 12680 / TGB-C1) TaxID=643648 RepID=D7CPK4_SYNLT|nr:hypothetical protein [Syntrophothermus lipocalidus]ADI02639.1 conserved hypothetical protein [Syntrophothermus lipocalidus DSM 12680]
MRVEGYQVSLTSSWQEKKTQVIEERLEVWDGGAGRGGGPAGEWLQADRVELSTTALQKAKAANDTESADDVELPSELEEKVRVVALLVEMFTGRKVEVNKLKLRKLNGETEAGEPAVTVPAGSGQVRRGWGLAYEYRFSYSEEERLSFSGQGVVKTADGRVLNFDFQLDMSRSFAAEERLSLRLGDAAVDPLVISFGDNGISFTTEPWEFDLNGDGVKEKLATLAPGAGFLVLDRNGDGVINDGREMFGPSIGDGWAELAAYDSDGNGWIDEGDSVYSQLRVLVPAGGSEVMFSLSELSVGAVFLGRVSTPFSFRSPANSDLAFLRSGGIYFKENGQAGFVGKVDMVDLKA